MGIWFSEPLPIASLLPPAEEQAMCRAYGTNRME